MKIHLDIENSKRRNWIITTRHNWTSRFDQFFFWVYSVMSILVAAFLLYATFKIEWSKSFSLVLLLLLFSALFLVGLISLFTLFTFNKLWRINGEDRQQNEKILQQIFKEQFGHQPTVAGDLLKIYRQPTLWKMGKRVVVILEGKDILINIATFDFRMIRSPIHGLFDFLQIIKIKRRLK